MNTKTELFLLRRKKRIPLKLIAEELVCSIALLSKYENNLTEISKDKEKKYKEYIENY